MNTLRSPFSEEKGFTALFIRANKMYIPAEEEKKNLQKTRQSAVPNGYQNIRKALWRKSTTSRDPSSPKIAFVQTERWRTRDYQKVANKIYPNRKYKTQFN